MTLEADLQRRIECFYCKQKCISLTFFVPENTAENHEADSTEVTAHRHLVQPLHTAQWFSSLFVAL